MSETAATARSKDEKIAFFFAKRFGCVIPSFTRVNAVAYLRADLAGKIGRSEKFLHVIIGFLPNISFSRPSVERRLATRRSAL